MREFVDDVIVTLKLKMGNYSKHSDAYKEIIYTIEMLECAKKLTREEQKSMFN
ncbi:MAG: hypothetical protein KA282_06100 [Clostridia bacterium]|nr:hypothetical protein [Clostridia bacterium]